MRRDGREAKRGEPGVQEGTEVLGGQHEDGATHGRVAKSLPPGSQTKHELRYLHHYVFSEHMHVNVIIYPVHFHMFSKTKLKIR